MEPKTRPCPRPRAAGLATAPSSARHATPRGRAVSEDLSYEVGATTERVRQRLQAWNNAPGRTFAEVKALLARVHARAKGFAGPAER